jgi:hypothetical protein
LFISAAQQTGRLYWHGMEKIANARETYGGILPPPFAKIPLITGYKTRIALSEKSAMGTARYQLMLINRSKLDVTFRVWLTPYPGDSSSVSKTLAPDETFLLSTPENEITWEAEARNSSNRTVTWEKRKETLSDEHAYGSCDEVTVVNTH